MIVRSGKSLQFDIRNAKSLGYDGLENDMIEAAYDTVNRMVLLIGDIPFGKLFTTPWVQLSLTCNVPDAQAAGLLNDAAAVYNAFDQLEAAGSMSWQSYINADIYREGDDAVGQALRVLNRQGIILPRLYAKPSTNKNVMLALNDLIEKAPELTYMGVFTESIPDYSKLEAVRASVRHDIISAPPNGKCCNTDSGLCVSGIQTQTCYYCGGGSGTSYC